ncbi:hypothetical protein M758_7G031500 [Ceratodon purpureus]|uniref:Uncharacterized protein n=1 Tax=Ceratodon purpureus TaxID=3225 RepID=A0A8T0H1P8_CERPU|nr:hypothetical protein KC19_7G032900 [Ceratodon purpureus]KAG0610003.1 hypothetical protein M758_7G031500 [Ceratodon purpureus]
MDGTIHLKRKTRNLNQQSSSSIPRCPPKPRQNNLTSSLSSRPQHHSPPG